jgi:Sigma-70 region 2
VETNKRAKRNTISQFDKTSFLSQNTDTDRLSRHRPSSRGAHINNERRQTALIVPIVVESSFSIAATTTTTRSHSQTTAQQVSSTNVVMEQPMRRKRCRERTFASSCGRERLLSPPSSATTVLVLLVTAGSLILCPSSTQAFSSSLTFANDIFGAAAAAAKKSAFGINNNLSFSPIRLAMAPRSSSGGGGVELVEPKTAVSPERRDAAIRAMKRDAMASVLDGVDAQVLEMLSEEFLFPSLSTTSLATSAGNYDGVSGQFPIEYEELKPDYGPPPSATRPNGRPAMVPGAMRRDTMMKYKKKRNLVKYLKQTTETAAASYQSSSTTSSSSSPPTTKARMSRTSNSSTKSMLDGLESKIHVKSREIARKKRRIAQQRSSAAARKAAKADLPTMEDIVETESTGASKPTRASKKRPVVKNLPKRKERDQDGEAIQYISMDDSFRSLMGSHSNSRKTRIAKASATSTMELRKYYQTELLTPEQEFELGHQIQLSVGCERVHEGLALRDTKLPTIREWAYACGYTDSDPDFDEESLINAEIRPAGADTMFEKTDPNLFIGNGLSHTMGVGSGRGRAKKPPPTALNDVFEIDTKTGRKKRGAKTPINRGTTSDFVDMMMDGRKAKQLMIQSNMRLVVSICRKYSNVGVGLHDLVQEGSIGLSRAADKYDPSKGFKFSTYASW